MPCSSSASRPERQLRIDSEGSVANTAISLHHANTDPLAPANLLACDSDIGPNGTGLFDAYLDPGTYYVVVKADGAGQSGAYQLNVRDVAAYPEKLLSCANSVAGDAPRRQRGRGSRLHGAAEGRSALPAGRLLDEDLRPDGLASTGAQLTKCQTICPNVDPFKFGVNERCASGQLTSNSFIARPRPRHLLRDGQGAESHRRGFYELQIGDSARGSSTKYVPKTWTDLIPVLASTRRQGPAGAFVRAGRVDRPLRRSGAARSARSRASRAQRTRTTSDLTRFINPKWHRHRLGAGARGARPRELPVDGHHAVAGQQPGLHDRHPEVHEHGRSAPGRVGCTAFTTGCADTTPMPRNRISDCAPGATPKFVVELHEPAAAQQRAAQPERPERRLSLQAADRRRPSVPARGDPGLHHPDRRDGAARRAGGPGSFQTMGTYEQQFFGVGCSYYQIEGEARARQLQRHHGQQRRRQDRPRHRREQRRRLRRYGRRAAGPGLPLRQLPRRHQQRRRHSSRRGV